MTKIACFGITVRDHVFTLPELPSKPGKYHALERLDIGGGVAANAAAAIARLGGDVSLFTALGDDRVGDDLVAELEQAGVDTSSIRRIAGLRSPVSAVMVDSSGERSIVNHTDRRLFIAANGPEPGEMEGADGVLVDVRWPSAATVALGWASDRGLPGVVDFDVSNADATALLRPASHVIFSAQALTALTGVTDTSTALKEVAAESAAWMAVTEGTDGTLWLDGDGLRRSPAFQVDDVVDTTGAGDVFHGVFALLVAERESEESALRHAAAAAALSCTKPGGRSGVPNRAELERFMERGP